MSTIGTFGERLLAAFRAYGRSDSRRIRLYGVIDDALKRNPYDLSEVEASISRALEDDPALVLEALDVIQFRRALIRHLMSDRVRVLRANGEHIQIPAERRDGAGQGPRETHGAGARPEDAASAAGESGQSGGGTQRHVAASPTDSSGHPSVEAQSSRAAATDDGGQWRSETHAYHAPVTNGAGQSGRGTQPNAARPTTNPQREPTQAQRLAAVKNRNKAAQTIMGRVSNLGKAFGDCAKSDFEIIVRRGIHEAQFARRVLGEVDFPDAETPLKQCANEAEIEKLWNAAWEATNHAA